MSIAPSGNYLFLVLFIFQGFESLLALFGITSLGIFPFIKPSDYDYMGVAGFDLAISRPKKFQRIGYVNLLSLSLIYILFGNCGYGFVFF